MLKRWWLFPVLAVAGVVAGTFVVAVLTYLQPKTFDSTAVVEVKQGNVVLTPFGEDEPQQARDPDFLRRQTGLMKSPKLLLDAVAVGDFKKKWHVDDGKAAEILGRSITVEPIRGTDLLSFRGRYTNREDARDMVTSLITAYRNQRKTSEENASAKALDELSKAVKAQEDRVEEGRAELAKHVGKYDLLHRDFRPDEKVGSTEDYVPKKQRFEADVEMLQTLKLKYTTEKVSQGMQDEAVVIHEEPQLAMVPSGPAVGRNMLYGMIGGLLASQVVALLLVVILPSRA